jgi:hypothetical protein
MDLRHGVITGDHARFKLSVAISDYVLIAVGKNRVNFDYDLYLVLKITIETLSEEISILKVLFSGMNTAQLPKARSDQHMPPKIPFQGGEHVLGHR